MCGAGSQGSELKDSWAVGMLKGMLSDEAHGECEKERATDAGWHMCIHLKSYLAWSHGELWSGSFWGKADEIVLYTHASQKLVAGRPQPVWA